VTAARRWLGIAVRAAGVLAVAVGLYFFVRGLDGRALLAALRDAAPAPIAVAAGLSFVNMLCKSIGWRVLLGPSHAVPILRLYRYTLAAFAGSLLVPARAGEALRVWLLRQRDGVPVTTSAAVAVSEKLLDGTALAAAVAPLLVLMPGLPAWVGRSIGLLLLGMAVGLVALWVVRRTAPKDGLLGRLAAGMTGLTSARATLLALGAYLLAHACDIGGILLVLRAVGVHVGPAVGMLILLGVNVAILVPATPGNLGSLEIGAMAALDLVGVPAPAAMAFALLYHAEQVIPLLIVGLADARLSFSVQRAAADG
jgi:uncharacterized membrane protein YbhN (UPF0104 family)